MKSNRSKRIFTALLALVLVLAVVPAPISAEEPTEPSTAQICPCCGENLADIQWKTLPADTSLPGGHYKVTADGQMRRAYTTSGVTTIDLNGYDLTTVENSRAFYVYDKTLTILDSQGGGSISATGAINDNGGLFRVGSKGILNIYGGSYTANELPAERKGGIMRVEGTVNMYGGTLTGGKTHHHGGNVNVSYGKFNLYGGTISGGETLDVGRGGNFYLTGNSILNIYGGTVTGGKSAGAGGNIFAYSGAQVNLYGGTVTDGYGKAGGHDIYILGKGDNGYSTLNIYGGIVGSGEDSLLRYDDYYPLCIYNGSFSVDPTPYLADCACVYEKDGRYIVWNYGHQDEICDETCPMEIVAKDVASFYPGAHYYVSDSQPNTCRCTNCTYVHYDPRSVAVADGKIYTELTEVTGKTQLLTDVSAEELVVTGTLDLNGYTLNAQAVTAASGKIIDRTQGQGILNTPSLSLAENNTFLAFREGAGLRFASLTPDATLERLDKDTVRIRFVFEEKAAQTIVDDLVNGGNTEVSVEFYLTWKDSQGQEKAKTYVCDPALLQKYAQKWDGRRFVATITGVEAVEDLTCTVRVAANGVTYSDTTLKNYDPINNILSWENINSYPLKTGDMTVDEMRQLCVDFFEYSKTFLWTPDESIEYVRNKNDSNDTMSQGTVYGGMPYVGNASGSPYRYMDYVNPKTGLVDMKKFMPAVGTADTLPMEALLYFGSQCAKTAGLGWGRVINSANYRATSYLLPANGVILLGDIEMDETKTSWSANYRTTQVCQENGKQRMFEAYAQLRKADGMVYYTTAGHVMMAYSDAVVVRNPDGTINGDESYVMIIHQAQKWSDQENEYGDQYQMKSSINGKTTFTKLYNDNYIPFTFPEFVSGDPVEETTLTLNEGETVLVSGTVREEDRAFVADTTTEDMTFSRLCGTVINSNYNIGDAYILVYNARGQVLYKHAVRNTSAIKNLKMAETGAQVDTWTYGKLEQGEVYHAELVVQLTTGERPTVWSGDLIF